MELPRPPDSPFRRQHPCIICLFLFCLLLQHREILLLVTLTIPPKAAMPWLLFGNLHRIIDATLAFHDLPNNEPLLQEFSRKWQRREEPMGKKDRGMDEFITCGKLNDHNSGSYTGHPSDGFISGVSSRKPSNLAFTTLHIDTTLLSSSPVRPCHRRQASDREEVTRRFLT